MKLFKKIFKRKKKSFKKMTSAEKSKFLRNDLIERLIRVEQRVAASFGEQLRYDQTKYFKSLSEQEKKSFEKYLKEKGKKHLWVVVILILIGGLFFYQGITGRVVGSNEETTWIEISSILFIITLSYILSIYLILKNIKRKRLYNHFNVLDNFISEKYLVKN